MRLLGTSSRTFKRSAEGSRQTPAISADSHDAMPCTSDLIGPVTHSLPFPASCTCSHSKQVSSTDIC
jgi:hypothetical protein